MYKGCGRVLDCENCTQMVECLGKDHWFFCSFGCEQDFERRLKKMKRLKNFLFDHPFKSLAFAGAWLTTICTLIYVFDNFTLLKSLMISGIIFIASAVVNFWITKVE